jgi:hypothetical protein
VVWRKSEKGILALYVREKLPQGKGRASLGKKEEDGWLFSMLPTS